MAACSACTVLRAAVATATERAASTAARAASAAWLTAALPTTGGSCCFRCTTPPTGCSIPIVNPIAISA